MGRPESGRRYTIFEKNDLPEGTVTGYRLVESRGCIFYKKKNPVGYVDRLQACKIHKVSCFKKTISRRVWLPAAGL